MSKTFSELPKEAQTLWKATYKSANKTHSEARSKTISWANVKNQFTKVDNRWVARTSDLLGFTTSKYYFSADEASIARGDDFTTVNYVIATSKSIGGVSLSPIALKRMSEQINSEGLTGRMDSNKRHSLLDSLRKKGLSEDEIEEELQKASSGIKADSAYVEGEKLVARIKLAKGIVPAKAVSIEARFPTESVREGITNQARAIGFVFTDTPADVDAVEV